MRSWGLAAALFAATAITTTLVGATMVDGMPLVDGPLGLALPARPLDGWVFSVPLLAILLAHELGHFVAARLHRVPVSPPYFIPMPLSLLGTMGAVIQMKGQITSRNALLDIGAAGPIAGFVVAIPVLVAGLLASPIEPLPTDTPYLIEGRSLLYLGLLRALKGPIAPGDDVFLSPTAFAGWAGLLVTMINLIPVAQLDGGHVAYALLGRAQDSWSERWRKGLPALAVGVSLFYVAFAYVTGDPSAAEKDWDAGLPWLVWAGALYVLTRVGGAEHPPVNDEPLSPVRRLVAVGTLALFVLLFMPAWVRER